MARMSKASEAGILARKSTTNTKGAIGAFHTMGKQCKDVSIGHPTFYIPLD